MPFFDTIIEERAISYIIREMRDGRELFAILDDPYVRNRIPQERRVALLENEDLLRAFECELRAMRLDLDPDDPANACKKD